MENGTFAPKTPVTPSGFSTALPQSCLIFQSTVRTQENHDIFCEKLSVMKSLQRPRHCHGALMAFYPFPTVFMVEILCALTVLSLRVHGAHSACAALSWRCHCVEDAVTSQRTPCSLRANATTTTAFAQRPLCAPMELLLLCRRAYCAAMVTLRSPLSALLGRRTTPSDSVCFEYAQSAHRRLAFYATPPCPMAMPLHCCGDACIRTAHTLAFCNFLGHCGITVRTPSWCDRGLGSKCSVFHNTF